MDSRFLPSASGDAIARLGPEFRKSLRCFKIEAASRGTIPETKSRTAAQHARSTSRHMTSRA